MHRIFYIFSAFIVCISCGTPQKTVENTNKKITPEINQAIIDSATLAHNKVAEKAENDSIHFTKNVKFVPSKELPYVSHHAWNQLLQKYVSKDGNVNYKGLKNDRNKLQEYIYYLGEHKPKENWSRNEKLAYWINAYNAFTVDLILQSYPAIKGIKNIRNPWKQELWSLEGKWYNLDTIEHDILRKMNEPRIHFAINCASFSCPPLLNEAFEASKMEKQLTKVTKAFLADSKRNTITKERLEISKIFKWFSSDFKQNGSLIDFLNRYSTVKISQDADIDYKEYDWTLNE